MALVLAILFATYSETEKPKGTLICFTRRQNSFFWLSPCIFLRGFIKYKEDSKSASCWGPVPVTPKRQAADTFSGASSPNVKNDQEFWEFLNTRRLSLPGKKKRNIIPKSHGNNFLVSSPSFPCFFRFSLLFSFLWASVLCYWCSFIATKINFINYIMYSILDSSQCDINNRINGIQKLFSLSDSLSIFRYILSV